MQAQISMNLLHSLSALCDLYIAMQKLLSVKNQVPFLRRIRLHVEFL